MNRIFTLVIASILVIAGGSVFAQQRPQSPDQPQQAEAIVYATERASNVPRFRRYRPPSIADAPKTAPTFDQRSHPYDEPQPKVVFTPPSTPQTLEAAPPFGSSSRRITRTKLATPATEISVPAPDAIESFEMQTDVVKTRTPAKASPNFNHRVPSDYGQEELQQSQWKPRPKQVQSEEKITLFSRVEVPQTTEAAPVIGSSSRRITRAKLATPATEILVSDYGQEELQQRQGKSRPKQVQSEEETTLFSRVEMPQTTEATPVIGSSSRRIVRKKLATPATEISVSAPDAIEPFGTQTDVVITRTPAIASPTFNHRVPSDFGKEELQQSQWKSGPKQVQSEEETTLFSLVDLPQTTATVPVIDSPSRRITSVKVPTREPEISVSAPITIEPAESKTDVVQTKPPTKASPNFKYRSPSDYGQEDLQQSQWKPMPKQVQIAKKKRRSSPVEPLETIDLPFSFEAETPAVSAVNMAVAVPLKKSRSTGFFAESAFPPTAETESTIAAVAPVASANTVLATKAKVGTPNEVHTSAGRETSRQSKATGAWWYFLPLLVVPFLAWLGWTQFIGKRYGQVEQFEEFPTIDIPRQRREYAIAQLSCETESQEIHSTDERPVAFESELLDEVHSIREITSNSDSAASSTLDSRAKSENS